MGFMTLVIKVMFNNVLCITFIKRLLGSDYYTKYKLKSSLQMHTRFLAYPTQCTKTRCITFVGVQNVDR